MAEQCRHASFTYQSYITYVQVIKIVITYKKEIQNSEHCAALTTLYRLYYIFVCDESNLIIFRYLSTHT